MISRYARRAFGFVAAAIGFNLSLGTLVHAQDALPFEEVRTLSSVVTPIEQKFTIDQSGAGSYRLVLTDLGFPDPMPSLKLAVTRGSTVVGTTESTGSATPKTLNFEASPGEYYIRAVGVLPASGLGSVGVAIYKGDSATPVVNILETLNAPPASRPNQAQIVGDFKAASSGTYEVVLSDFAFPQPLTDLLVSVVDVDAGPPAKAQLSAAGTTTFTAQKDVNYRVSVIGQASDAIGAGLFSVRIRPAGATTPEFLRVQELGRVKLEGSPTLAAGAHVLSVRDLQFPSQLAEIGAAVALDGAPVASSTTSGDVSFNAAAGQYAVYSVARTSGALLGSYGIEIRDTASGATPLSIAKSVGGATGTSPAYQFVANIATAGNYRVRLADFAFPSALAEIQLGVSQDGQLLGTLSAAGTLDLTNVKAGALYLVALSSPTGEAGGVFGIDIAPAGSSTTVFDATQGVGNLFSSRKVSATGSTAFRVALTDLAFPRAFKDLGAIVTRGADVVGKVLNSSQFDFNATPGNYFINFIATPAETEPTKAGTYGLRVAEKPPAPVVTLTASQAQVNTGGEVTLSWSVTNATTCTASNGWTGSRPLKGDELIRGLNAASTYMLECTGEGGTSSATVTVAVVAEAATDKGGGGALGWLSLLALGVAGAGRRASRRRLAA